MIVGNPKDSAADLAVAIANTWDTFEEPYERLATLDDLRRFLDRVGQPEAARVTHAGLRLADAVEEPAQVVECREPLVGLLKRVPGICDRDRQVHC